MFMKNFTLLIICLLCTIGLKADCTNAYSSASYALAHAKKALSADNFDHQRYYAERALEAFEKTQAMTADCGCDASSDPIFKGIENLKKAIDPKDWEMGRYYTKKAVANAHELLAALDRCTSGAEAEDLGTETFDESEDATGETLKNPEELEAQQNLKRLAELTIYEFEKSIRELAELLGCDVAQNLEEELDERSEEALKAESLEETREFYREQTIAIQRRALQALQDCTGNAGDQATDQGKS